MNKKEQIKKNVLKRVLSIIGNTVFVLLFVITIAVIFMTVLNKTLKDPNIAGYRLYSVLGGSMVPSIKTGALVIIKPK